jgi:hypothetical protein
MRLAKEVVNDGDQDSLKGPLYVLELMQTRDKMLPINEIKWSHAYQVVSAACGVVPGTDLTIQHLVKRGLLKLNGSLPSGICLLIRLPGTAARRRRWRGSMA